MNDSLDCDEYRSLLRAVLTEPASDLFRLVLADWLDERAGDAGALRADLIRADVEAAAIRDGGGVVDAMTKARQHRAWDAFDAAGLMEAEWAVPLRTALAVDRSLTSGAGCCERYPYGPACDCYESAARLTWGRGFVERVELTQDAYLGHAGAIFSAHPVTAVTLTDKRPSQRILPPPLDFGETDRHRPIVPARVWEWWSDGLGEVGSAGVDTELFREIWGDMTGVPDLAEGGRYALRYPTEGLADAALCRGLVAVGRRRAGLPRLPLPSEVTR